MITKQELIIERGEFCECGCGRKSEDLHHCLIHTMKKYRDELTCRENCMLLSRNCHADGFWKSYAGAVAFWAIQCARYGEQHMRAWLAGLPMKIKPKF